jgi:2,5-diamino-6-(ribosylamino)-4(3H)-pyrimidinone 5'-phosphate reductase
MDARSNNKKGRFMLPKVILHDAVSLDGRIDGFPIDLFQYYELAASWKEDATLAGSDTFLKAASEAPPEDESAFLPPKTDPGDSRALLAIPDSRGRIRTWHYLRSLPYWHHFVALCSESTPQEYLDYLKERHIDYIIAGQDHVDLRVALEELNSRFGVKVVRVDAGGTLNGQLLRKDLVNEVSLLIYPSLVGGEKQSSIFRAPDLPAIAATTDPVTGLGGMISLKLLHMERLTGEVIWLRYEVK